MKHPVYLDYQKRTLPFSRRRIRQMVADGIDPQFIQRFRRGILACCRDARMNCIRFLPWGT